MARKEKTYKSIKELAQQKKKRLFKSFLYSPFPELDLDITRSKDLPRDIDLKDRM